MVRNTFVAAAALMTLFAASANAQVLAPSDPDLRCALVGLNSAGQPGATAEQQQSAGIFAIYYIGRMQGRTPGVDLDASIRQAASTVTLDMIAMETPRCAGELQRTGQLLVAMGESMLGGAEAEPK